MKENSLLVLKIYYFYNSNLVLRLCIYKNGMTICLIANPHTKEGELNENNI